MLAKCKVWISATCLGLFSLGAQALPLVLENGYIKVGVSDYGTLGSGGDTPPGILFDKTGNGQYGINDFLTPGSPFEGFYLKMGNTNYTSNNNFNANGFAQFSLTKLSLTAATATAVTNDGMLRLTNRYELRNVGGQAIIAINTQLDNLAPAQLSGLSFLRTLDPDPDANQYGIYDTDNVKRSNNQVCATGRETGETICLSSFDALTHQSGISVDWSTDPEMYLAGINDGHGDNAIGLAFNIGDLAANGSVNFNYQYSLGATSEIAGGGTVPEPATFLLAATGLLALARRRNKASR